MTYANHRVTEITENAQRFFIGHPKTNLCVASVFSVSPWLAYVINIR